MSTVTPSTKKSQWKENAFLQVEVDLLRARNGRGLIEIEEHGQDSTEGNTRECRPPWRVPKVDQANLMCRIRCGKLIRHVETRDTSLPSFPMPPRRSTENIDTLINTA